MRFSAVLTCVLLTMAGCGGPEGPSIEDLAGGGKLSAYKLGALRGARDGDRLDAQAMFSDSSSTLTMEMRYRIGSPTTLESGTWQWTRNNELRGGSIAARSVTFLGGQNGPPSIGGRFDLLGPDGAPRYRVNIPVTELKARPGEPFGVPRGAKDGGRQRNSQTARSFEACHRVSQVAYRSVVTPGVKTG